MPSGGYRKPANPAPVSGPGALSRRTDGGPAQPIRPIPANGQYGARKDMIELQSGAPMAGNPQVQPDVSPLTGMFDPTNKPEEPITAGADFGPGPGSEVLNAPMRGVSVTQTFNRLAQSDPTGEIEMILRDLNARGIE
jgi:hypothetical protein